MIAAPKIVSAFETKVVRPTKEPGYFIDLGSKPDKPEIGYFVRNKENQIGMIYKFDDNGKPLIRSVRNDIPDMDWGDVVYVHTAIAVR